MYRTDARKKGFKKGIDIEDARRKREDESVQLRKIKRDESAMKKRRERHATEYERDRTDTLTAINGALANHVGPADTAGISPLAVSVSPEQGSASGPTDGTSIEAQWFGHAQGTRNGLSSEYRAPDARSNTQLAAYAQKLPDMVAGVLSDNANEQVRCTTEFRKMLSVETEPPIDQVIELGVVPRFVQFLRRDDNPRLQFEAEWALTNIASGTSAHTAVVMEHGAVPLFIQLLRSPHEECREQAAWAIGNIAGDSPRYRNVVLDAGVMMPLLEQLTSNSGSGLLRNSAWTLSNLCRGKPEPPFEIVSLALPVLAHLLFSPDPEVLVDSSWALSYLSDGSNEKIQAVVESGVVRRLVELLAHDSVKVQTPCLRVIGNLVTGNDIQTQVVINSSALVCLSSLLNSPKKAIRKEACWAISNITAGTADQVQAVIDAGIFQQLMYLMETADYDIKKECAWAISNATSAGYSDQIKFLVKQGCIPPLCNLLDSPDAKIVAVALDGLDAILKVGEQSKQVGADSVNPYAVAVEECGGLEKIEALQSHQLNEIYQKVVSILEVYFVADEEPVEMLEPEVSGSQFAFGFEQQHVTPSNGYSFQE